jgi:hypothetical protein
LSSFIPDSKISWLVKVTAKKTYPGLELLLDEGFEKLEDHVEHKWLLHDVHRLEADRHGVLQLDFKLKWLFFHFPVQPNLNEGEKAHGKRWRKCFDLLHAHALEVHNYDHTVHL